MVFCGLYPTEAEEYEVRWYRNNERPKIEAMRRVHQQTNYWPLRKRAIEAKLQEMKGAKHTSILSD